MEVEKPKDEIVRDIHKLLMSSGLILNGYRLLFAELDSEIIKLLIKTMKQSLNLNRDVNSTELMVLEGILRLIRAVCLYKFYKLVKVDRDTYLLINGLLQTSDEIKTKVEKVLMLTDMFIVCSIEHN
jgi:hypothetical protein